MATDSRESAPMATCDVSESSVVKVVTHDSCILRIRRCRTCGGTFKTAEEQVREGY